MCATALHLVFERIFATQPFSRITFRLAVASGKLGAIAYLSAIRLWHAIDRRTGQVLAYVFRARKDKIFLQLSALLKPFGIKRYCTDGWGAYQRYLESEKHEVGKRKTQRIERNHLGLRTRIKRLARKTICFSKSELMHDLVIGLFINRYEFGLLI